MKRQSSSRARLVSVLRHAGTAIGVLAAMLCFSYSASAQVARLSGTVSFKENETAEAKPRAKVQILILREDIKAQYKTETDKNGRYLYSLPMFGRYIVVAHGKDLKTEFSTLTRLGGDLEINLTVVPGDGVLPATDQIIAAASAAAAPQQQQLSKEQIEAMKKEQEAYEKAKAENEKIKAEFEQMKQHFEAGRAFSAQKNYEGAIVEYKKAAELDPTQHIIFYNLAESQFNFGAGKFNAKDREGAKPLFVDSAQNAVKAGEVLQTAIKESASNPQKATELKNNEVIYKSMAAKSYALLGQYYGDFESAGKAATIYREAADAQADPKEKGKLLVKAGESFFSSGQIDQAVTVYREILTIDPANHQAMFNLALALAGDTTKMAEATSLLEKVANEAADAELKKNAAEAYTQLKGAAVPTTGGSKKKKS